MQRGDYEILFFFCTVAGCLCRHAAGGGTKQQRKRAWRAAPWRIL
jgi:hypothetical protein